MVRPVAWAPAVFDVDRYGNKLRQTPQWDTTPRSCWVGRTSAQEVLGERTSGVESEWILFSDDVSWQIDAADQVQIDGKTYEVDGPPHTAWTPDGPHHLEVPLKLVEG